MCGWGHFTRGMRDAYTFRNNTPTDTLRAWGDFVVASQLILLVPKFRVYA